MTTTTVLSEDTATIVRDDAARVQWGAIVAGAVIATAVTFLLVSFGSAVGLSLVSAHGTMAWGVKTFLTAGAIYFLIAQAFGFAVGGHVTGRLLGFTADDSEEETFRADVHGLAVWGLGVIFGLGVLALTAGPTLSAGVQHTQPAGYFADKLFRGATTELSGARIEAARLLTADTAQPNTEDHQRLIALTAMGTGLSGASATVRVDTVEDQMREQAKTAAKAAAYVSIWTALALLFSAAVCVAATLSARWHADHKVFGNRALN